MEQINTANSQLQGDSENPGTVRPLGTTFPTGNERDYAWNLESKDVCQIS